MEKLTAHWWPGNVRELENKVKQAAMLADGHEISAEHVLFEGSPPRAGGFAVDASVPYAAARDHFEREYLVQCLRLHRGAVTKAADAMGVHRNSIYHLLKKHGLDPATFR
jgi:DNA-binding NtrC family response regulator